MIESRGRWVDRAEEQRFAASCTKVGHRLLAQSRRDSLPTTFRLRRNPAQPTKYGKRIGRYGYRRTDDFSLVPRQMDDEPVVSDFASQKDVPWEIRVSCEYRFPEVKQCLDKIVVKWCIAFHV